MVKQVALLTAGCQPWNSDVCATTTNRFAYCATLAVYIFQRDENGEYRLHSIMSEHKKTITALCWNPRNSDQIVTVGVDEQVIVWDVSQQRVIASHVSRKGVPRSVGWSNHEQDAVAFTGSLGPLVVWQHCNPDSPVTFVKDTQSFSSEICQLRWHPRKPGRLVFGHRNGSLSIINTGQKPQRHVLQPEMEEGEEQDERVTALEWDPLSMDYILVSTRSSGVRLLDVEALTVIMDFDLPSAATTVHTLDWVENAPGIFVTGDSQSGMLRIWNVSKSTPLENVRLKKTGFHCLSVVCNHHKEPRTVRRSYLSSTSQVTSPSVRISQNIALPSTSVLCGFVDGGVGLYDLGNRKWNFVKEKGHMETIFDCEFRPDNPDILATSSFDGTIKVWDVSTMTPIASSPGNEGVIYCVSWAPADLNCIVASTSKLGAFIWDISKGKIVQRFSEHGSSSVYCVSWSKKDSARVLSCGGDGYCIVRQIDGTLIQKYKHPGGVFGGDWSPHNKDMLATGCEDKNVRVFYLPTTSDQPLKVFSGHSAKVFRVKWSPLREGILCSGSDDGTIRVWDYTQEACVNVLSGHSAPVRGLLWNPEVPYLLISGSWDYTIRIWDTRDGACVHIMLDHGADVYGLTSHPSRPFIVASSSRDSTLRLWSITSVVQPIQLNLLAGKPWDTVIGAVDRAMAQGSPPMLTGKVSRELRQQIDRLQGNVEHRTLRFFSKFFMPPSGTANLWELVSVVKGLGDSLLSANYSQGIMHVKHLCRVKASEAQQLEMVKMSRFGAGLGAPSKEDSLRAAAHLHIRLGNLQRYCELMVELGQWEKALAVSPGVSMEYWQGLSQRYASYLIGDMSEEALPFCMATRDTESLVHFLVSQGQAEDAVLAAQVACEDGSPPAQPQAGAKHCPGQLINGDSPTQDSLRLLTGAIEAWADSYFRKGSPTLAACCHLAVSDCEGAMRKLVRGNELELAVSVGKVLGSTGPLTYLALTYLARRCEDMGRWELAVDLLNQIPANEILLAQLCSRCAASMDEINSLHKKAGFPSMDECLLEGERLKDDGDTFNSVKFLLLSTSPEVGLALGINKVKAVMCEPGWRVDDVTDLLNLLGAVRTEKLLHPTCDRLRFELLSLCAYIGALLAVRRQYDDIVPALFSHARKMAEKGGVELPVSSDLMEREHQAWISHRQVGKSGEAVTEDMQPVYDSLLARTGEEGWCVGVGADCAASTHLPSHSDVHTSYLTGHRIQGQAFFLEDGRSAISINEALMWAKVNPFSPLGSGLRINPF